MIEIVPYDASWPAQFALEAANLRTALGGLALRIEHVGSTSVPGLEAKPVIDIQVSVAKLSTLSAYATALVDLGYVHVPDEAYDAIYPFFQKPGRWPSTHHVHLCVPGSEIELRTLAFRDYLRGHPEVVARYAALKQQLAAIHGGATAQSREHYALDKSDFIASVLDRARAAGRPL